MIKLLEIIVTTLAFGAILGAGDETSARTTAGLHRFTNEGAPEQKFIATSTVVAENGLAPPQWRTSSCEAQGGASDSREDCRRTLADITEATGADSQYWITFQECGRAYDEKGEGVGAEGERWEAERMRPEARINKLVQAKDNSQEASKSAPRTKSDSSENDKSSYDDCEKLEGDPGIAACTSAIKENDEDDWFDPYPYMYRGLKHMDLQNYDRAIDDLSIAADSGVDVGFYFYRGQAYQLKVDHTRAILDFTKFLEKKPGHADARLRRGLSYEYLDRFDEAIADYEKAIASTGADAATKVESHEAGIGASATKALNRTKATKGCFHGSGDAAIAACSELVGLSPDNAGAYFARAVEYESKGDYDRAIIDYDKAISLDPERAKFYAGRGDSHSAKGDYDRAMADFDKAIELDQTRAAAYGGRAGVYFAKQDFANALRDYGKNVELDPKSAKARFNRGLTYERLGKREDAIADYKGALLIKPDHANSQKALERLGVK